MTTAFVIDPAQPLLELLEQEFMSLGLRDEASELPFRLWDQALYRPLADFLSRPGKEFRGRLVAAGWELAGGKTEMAPELPLLVEVLHAGSLIVDDIEDGSAERRGQPALHLRYGMATALNAGNWLYFWPFALLERAALPAAMELALHRAISRTLLACHRGQALDLGVRMDELAQSEVPKVVAATTRLKTGSLMELAASLGPLALAAPQPVSRALATFGRELGVALQMLDDLGGILSVRRCHKGHEDLLADRPTWPWAWLATELDEPAFKRLRKLAYGVKRRDEHPETLALALRKQLGAPARERVHQHVGHAFDELKAALGSSPALNALKHELQRLQNSYE